MSHEYHEAYVHREDARADNQIARRIGPWTIVAKRERHETPSGKRAVYVIRHDDGREIGLKGWRLNALIVEARLGGIS